MTITNSNTGRDAPFRVIIVGAGVAGLVLAHALEKASIDFILLDKGIVAPPWGTSITIHPHGCRILHQIDCLDTVSALCSPMGLFFQRDQSGKELLSQGFFDAIARRTGYTTLTLERRAYLQVLYDKLPDKSKVVEHARVENIIEENGIVRVILGDGTEQVGDLVVGADGVHSKVRELLWKNANEAIPGFISAVEKRSMRTTYNALIAFAPMQAGLGKYDMHCVSNDKFSFLILCQPETIFFVAHCKLPDDKQCRWPNRARYTQEDMDNLATKLADYPVSESLLFGELWRNRTRAHLVSLEEGVLDHWFFGRTVLAGDSVHKVTPNAAFGGSTAMESAVALANVIHHAVNLHPNKKPSDVEMKTALTSYQASRLARVKEIFNVSWMLTRLQAYDGWLFYFIQRWVMPVIGLDFVAKQIAQTCSEAPKLNYVQFAEERGTLGWKEGKDAIKYQAAANRKKIIAWHGPSGAERVFPVMFGGILLVTSTVLWLSGWNTASIHSAYLSIM
ncbi:hypothetical protein WAI453_001167 [Rhynchosporium graminicola]|uniref:FAD-binding domain-containing protein n=1 Tax=Rhynchosporium graminicola TaxID=2792576 RepID=A0A1E1K6Z7_9HELO|nr:uncharacterized protein RCO7_09466 [Rhynchosporium commune]